MGLINGKLTVEPATWVVVVDEFDIEFGIGFDIDGGKIGSPGKISFSFPFSFSFSFSPLGCFLRPGSTAWKFQKVVLGDLETEFHGFEVARDVDDVFVDFLGDVLGGILGGSLGEGDWVNDDEWGEGENEEIDIDEGVAVKVTWGMLPRPLMIEGEVEGEVEE
jgi:hypothetical protein